MYKSYSFCLLYDTLCVRYVRPFELMTRIELVTSSLPQKRSTGWATSALAVPIVGVEPTPIGWKPIVLSHWHYILMGWSLRIELKLLHSQWRVLTSTLWSPFHSLKDLNPDLLIWNQLCSSIDTKAACAPEETRTPNLPADNGLLFTFELQGHIVDPVRIELTSLAYHASILPLNYGGV